MNLKEKPPVQEFHQLNNEIGLRIKIAREKAGLKQHELAEIIGVCPQTISAMECGRYRPKYENLIKICNALNISCDYIIRGIDGDILDKQHLSKLRLLPVEERLSVAEDLITGVRDSLVYR